MPRVALDLNRPGDRHAVKGEWRVGPRPVPGEPNEGLTARIMGSPARLAEYDDSAWEACADIRASRSVGFTFAWFRMAVQVPERLEGIAVAGARVWFVRNPSLRVARLDPPVVVRAEDVATVCETADAAR